MTRAAVERITQEQGVVWHTPPARQGQIVTISYGEDEHGRLYRRVEDYSLPPDHPDRVYLYRAQPPDDPDWSWAPWFREPQGVAWHRVAETREER